MGSAGNPEMLIDQVDILEVFVCGLVSVREPECKTKARNLQPRQQ